MYERIMKVALPQIRCQLHDHAKQYDNDGACHNKRNGGKLHGNICRNGSENSIIGRYGGCFEEDIRRFMCDRRIISRGLDAPAKFAPTIKVRKGNARYRRC